MVGGATHSVATLSFDTAAAHPALRVCIIYGGRSVPEDRTFALSEMSSGE
jgi:hypothetical protein